jgi:hypothetical protein
VINYLFYLVSKQTSCGKTYRLKLTQFSYGTRVLFLPVRVSDFEFLCQLARRRLCAGVLRRGAATLACTCANPVNGRPIARCVFCDSSAKWC